MTAYTLSSTHAAILEQLAEMRRARAGERSFGYNLGSVELRGISTTRAESHRLSEPRSSLLIPGPAGVSSFEESAE